MSQLMIQMTQEMNRRAAGISGDPSQSGGTSNDSKKEMRMDEKWIPAMRNGILEVVDFKRSRVVWILRA